MCRNLIPFLLWSPVTVKGGGALLQLKGVGIFYLVQIMTEQT